MVHNLTRFSTLGIEFISKSISNSNFQVNVLVEFRIISRRIQNSSELIIYQTNSYKDFRTTEKMFALKLVYKDHQIVAIIDKWPLFRGHLYYKRSKWELKVLVYETGKVVGNRRWLMVIRWGLTVYSV